MANQQLIDAVSQLQAGGVPDDQIKQLLVQKGWVLEDINGTFALLRMSAMPTTAVRREIVVSTRVTEKPVENWLAELVTMILIAIVGIWAYLYFTKTSIAVPLFNKVLPSYASSTGDVPTASAATINSTSSPFGTVDTGESAIHTTKVEWGN